MQKLFWSITFSFLAVHLFAQAISSSIQSVKVFRQNAEVSRKTNVKLIPGTQEIVLTGISTMINPSSIQVKVDRPSVTLLSVKYKQNYLQVSENSDKEKKLFQRIKDINEEIDWLKEQRSILKGVEEVLNKNQDLGGRDQTFTAAQVMELANTYKAKYIEIRKEALSLKKQEAKLNKAIEALKKQVAELNANDNAPSGNIVLKLATTQNTSTNLICTYTVRQAGWFPLYDLRSEGIASDVQLFYKASIYQKTGVAWKNVKVTVSTGNPAQNQNRPILYPLYVNFNGPYASNEKLPKKTLGGLLYARNMALEDKEEVAKDGFGYQAEVVTNQTTVKFVLPNKQTILADRKENLVSLESYKLETKYVYHTVPKINKGAFLIAKIKNWGQYNLESGEANIFFDGAYVGKTNINANVTSDELLVSMGLDNGIVVARKPVKEFSSKKLFGAKKKETYAFDIVVKNKKSAPIEIEVLDQIPISQNDKISVELQEKGSGVYDAEIGKLHWKFEIKPGQTKKERFIYTVKYPKGQAVFGAK